MGVSAKFDEPSGLIRNDGALRLQRGSATSLLNQWAAASQPVTTDHDVLFVVTEQALFGDC